MTYEEKVFSEKQCASVRTKIKEKKIAAKASRVGPSLRTVVCQLFRFVAMTNGWTKSNLKPTSDQLLSKITISAYLEFYSQYTKSPKTVSNAAKILISLYKYMLVSIIIKFETLLLTRYYRHAPSSRITR